MTVIGEPSFSHVITIFFFHYSRSHVMIVDIKLIIYICFVFSLYPMVPREVAK